MNCRPLLRFTWRSIRLFDCVGVPVQFHTTTLIWPCGFICWLGWIDFGTRGFIRSALFLGVLYGSLLVHEFAHVLTARRFGCRTKRVLLLPIGCVAELEAIPQESFVLRELSQSQPAFLNLGSSRLARTELNTNDVRGSQVTPL